MNYLLDHYDWLRDDLPVDSLAFELIIVRGRNDVSVQCSYPCL